MSSGWFSMLGELGVFIFRLPFKVLSFLNLKHISSFDRPFLVVFLDIFQPLIRKKTEKKSKKHFWKLVCYNSDNKWSKAVVTTTLGTPTQKTNHKRYMSNEERYSRTLKFKTWCCFFYWMNRNDLTIGCCSEVCLFLIGIWIKKVDDQRAQRRKPNCYRSYLSLISHPRT